MPGIIAFLGHNPLPEATTLAERLVRHRTMLGICQKKAAGDFGVDQGTRGGSAGSGSRRGRRWTA